MLGLDSESVTTLTGHMRGLTKDINQSRFNNDSSQGCRRADGKHVRPVECDGLVVTALLLVDSIPPLAPVDVIEL